MSGELHELNLIGSRTGSNPALRGVRTLNPEDVTWASHDAFVHRPSPVCETQHEYFYPEATGCIAKLSLHGHHFCDIQVMSEPRIRSRKPKAALRCRGSTVLFER